MRGVPFELSIEEVIEFFGDNKPLAGSIKLGQNKFKARTGYAVVRFSDTKTLEDVMKKYQGKHLKSRWVELFVIDENTYNQFEHMYTGTLHP